MGLTAMVCGKIMLIIYLSICAYQDFKTKHIDLRVCVVFYILSILMYMYRLFSGHTLDYAEIMFGLIPALIIFALSKITRSAIGMGDGYFFLGLGFGMGISAVAEVIFYSVLSMAIASLILVLYYLCSDQTGKGKSIPMIPYVLLPGIWVILR